MNKPPGPSSHDIIDQQRKIIGIKQIGHAGTLDPFASGLLLVGIGEATKLLRHYVGLDKKYEAVLRLGAVSDTQDRTGKIANSKQLTANRKLTKKEITEVLQSFIGKQLQIPPMYSAKKIGGKRLYKLALEGKEVKRKPVEIEVYDLKLLSLQFSNSPIPNTITINCRVSSGTYIRALAHDIGQALGCGAYLEELKRTAIGDFKLEEAVSLRHSERSEAESKNLGGKQQDPSTSARVRASAQGDVLKHLIPLKTVLITGTFDGLHEGHKNYFQQARQHGQRLIAIIARDKIVEKIKGRAPRYSEKERVAFVKQCNEIDRVYLGVLENVFDFTASLKPDVIALGYDQTAYTDNLEQEMKNRGLATAVVRLKSFYPEKYKSSRLNAF